MHYYILIDDTSPINVSNLEKYFTVTNIFDSEHVYLFRTESITESLFG